MRGALFSAAFFTPLYLAANQFDLSNGVSLITQLAGVWLIPILFAYPSSLLKTINQARDELSAARDELTRQNETLGAAHRQLKVIHDLTGPPAGRARPHLRPTTRPRRGDQASGFDTPCVAPTVRRPCPRRNGNLVDYPINSSFPRHRSALPRCRKWRNFQISARTQTVSHWPRGRSPRQSADLNSWLKTCRSARSALLSFREHAVGILMVELDKHEELTARHRRRDRPSLQSGRARAGRPPSCHRRARRTTIGYRGAE